MERIKTFKVILLIVIMLAGIICMLLPEKNARLSASEDGVMSDDKSILDTLGICVDSSIME